MWLAAHWRVCIEAQLKASWGISRSTLTAYLCRNSCQGLEHPHWEHCKVYSQGVSPVLRRTSKYVNVEDCDRVVVWRESSTNNHCLVTQRTSSHSSSSPLPLYSSTFLHFFFPTVALSARPQSTSHFLLYHPINYQPQTPK